jgi:predicted transcriptional regulator
MIGKQLKHLLEAENIKINDFAEIIGIKARTVYTWTNDTNEPKHDTLLQIKQKFKEKTGKNINLDWLISGEGTMFTNDTDEKRVTVNFEALIKEAGMEFDENGYLKKKKP